MFYLALSPPRQDNKPCPVSPSSSEVKPFIDLYNQQAPGGIVGKSFMNVSFSSVGLVIKGILQDWIVARDVSDVRKAKEPERLSGQKIIKNKK